MAGAIIEIKYDDRELKSAFRRLQTAGGDLSAAFAEIGEQLIRSHRQRFADGEDPDGKKWDSYAPLSKKTLARKKKNADKVLIEHGGLMDSLHYNASAKGLEFGTNLIYGATHQFGREEDGIPARPFLGISSEDEHEILIIIEDHISQAMNN